MWQVVAQPFGLALSALIAFVPLLWLLVSLGVWKMPAYKACSIGLLITLILAVIGWQMPPILALKGAADGAVLAIMPIIWVIFAAIFAYNITLKTGAMDKIKGLMASFSNDRRVQVLLIAWGFGGFMEAAAGYGTAVAIPAAILTSLGFNPFIAAVLCLIANTAPVAFGAVGIPIITLAKVADLNAMILAFYTALQLTPFILIVPLALILVMTKSLSGLKGVFGMAVVAGVFFAVPQLLVTAYLGPELTSVVGSVSAMIGIVIWNKISPPTKVWKFAEETDTDQKTVEFKTSLSEQLIAWSPYIFLFIFVLGTNNVLSPALSKILGTVKTSLPIYDGPGGKPMIIAWLLTPGTLIIIGAILGGFLQGASASGMITVFKSTAASLQKTAVTIIAIVALARVMGYSGMVSDIAVALAQTTGSYYPLISPLIGALGTFVTGSDTSANVLFGALQKQTAIQIGANPSWIAAANTSGGTVGKMISPQSIAIATVATNQAGKEGDILQKTAGICVVYAILLGIWVYIVSATHLFM